MTRDSALLIGRIIPLARQWLEECITTHPSCSHHARHSEILCTDNSHFIMDIDIDKLLPSRILEIRVEKGATGDNECRVHLVACASLPADTGYTTLSYRWGDATKRVLATTSNLTTLMNDGIPMEELPRTFRDAVEVTRGLGYSYLWIDALCIIQDDQQDWKREARNMAMIYGKSVCTIMAMDCADATCGLADENTSLGTVDSLETRGWVCQERMISPRSLVFSDNSVHWECRECDASEAEAAMSQRNAGQEVEAIPEHPKDVFTFFRDWRLPSLETSSSTGEEETQDSDDGVDCREDDDSSDTNSNVNIDESGCVVLNYDSNELPGHTANLKNYIKERGTAIFDTPLTVYPDNDQDNPFGRFLKQVTDLTHAQEAYYPFIKVWWQFLHNYTPRRLTFSSDRFLAMNGVANIAQRWTHLRSTFGLWFHFLQYELCWYVDPDTLIDTRRPATWLGPSWSWVSTADGCVRNDLYPMLPEYTGALQIRPEITPPVATTFDMPLPLEAWMDEKYHSIELHGNLRQASVTTTQDADGKITCNLAVQPEGRFSNHAVYEFRPDCTADFPVDTTIGVFCLHMWHYNAELLDMSEYLDVYIVVKQLAAGEENIPLEYVEGNTSRDGKLDERRMRRVGYLKATYGRGEKRNVDEIEGKWWWMKFV